MSLRPVPRSSSRFSFALRVATGGCALLVGGCATAGSAVRRDERDATVQAVVARTMDFLNAYATDDGARVESMLDPEGVAIYGSDASERVVTTAQFRQLMIDDFKLWHTARFGEPQHVSARVGDSLASVFFDVPFSAGGRPEILVRMAVVWRRVDGQWRLSQSSNVVPTVGSSAGELTAPR